MAFGTLNSILSTAVSITYTCCCAIVLMLHNVPRVCVGRIINAKFYEMKHTEKYLQAKWVTENPDGYDERDVVDAKRYCNAYLDGYNQALRIHDVSQQRELLKAFCEWAFREDSDWHQVNSHIDGYLDSL